MIRYDLICAEGHGFDGWFSNSAAYDAQAKRNLVECTVCGSTKIEKQLMAPGIRGKSNRKDVRPMAAGPLDPRAKQMMDMMRQFRKAATDNAEYVGPRFAEEARKIHYKESEERGIYGEASQDDAKALVEEGIEVHPLPRLPEDGN